MSLTGSNALVWISQQGGFFTLCATNTKKPIDKAWTKTPHPLAEALDFHLRQGNIGLLTGSVSNHLRIIDIDVNFETQLEKLGIFGQTTLIRRERSPDRGKLLYRCETDLPSRAFILPGNMKPQVEYLGDDRHAMIPPSKFEGESYVFEQTDYGILTITEVDLQSIWHILTGTLLQPRQVRSVDQIRDEMTDEDRHNESLLDIVKNHWKTAFQVFEHFGWTTDARRESDRSQWRLPGHGGLIISDPEGPIPWKWYCHAQSIGGDQIDAWLFCQSQEALDRSDRTTFVRVLKEMCVAAGIPEDQIPTVSINRIKQETFPYTDLGNALRLASLYKDQIRFSQVYGKWVVWNGRVWAIDQPGGLHDFRVGLLTDLRNEALSLKDRGLQGDAIRWVITSQSSGHLGSCLKLASEIPDLFLPGEQMDQHPMILNCNNGMIDLRTGQLLPHDPSYFCTKITPIDYDPLATCPKWMKFLCEIQSEREDMVQFLQRWVGYSLTGLTNEQALCFCHGGGANGKSTFLSIIFELLGEYGTKSPTEMIMYRSNGKDATNDVAALKGSRFVLTAELEGDRRLAEGLVKDLTGGDILTARFLYQEFFRFTPTHKLWIYGNSKPIIRGLDDGIWRRIHLIPFERIFEGSNKNPFLLDELREELPGILAWAVRGCLDWLQGGLRPPDIARKATNEYRSEMNVIRDFIDRACLVEGECLLKDLFEYYVSWCRQQTFRHLGKKDFARELEKQGFEKTSNSSNQTTIIGLAPLPSSGGSGITIKRV